MPTENSYGFYDYTNLIQTAVEFNEEIIVLEEGARKGIDYLDQELEKSNPILVGVRHTYYKYIEGNTERRHKKNELNKNKSTDHFITIVGRGCEDGKRFFRFYEVGTSNSANGQHDENKLFIPNDLSLPITGIPQSNLNRTYTLTHVRGNKTNGNFK